MHSFKIHDKTSHACQEGRPDLTGTMITGINKIDI